MACGAVVCTNFNQYTEWLFKNEENSLLFEISRSSIKQVVARAVEDAALRSRVSETAAQRIASFSNWEETCSKIAALVMSDEV
jgi:glycosyltransferase involved in cell wall biosynthesis